MAQLARFTFPAPMEEPAVLESQATLTQKRQQPQLHLLTDNATNEQQKVTVPDSIFSGPAVIQTLSTPPMSPTRKRSMTMGAPDPRSVHNSGAVTPPITPGSVSHSKSNSTSSDFLSSLSTLRRGSSISSLNRPRLSLDASPQPGSTELTTFSYHLTDYEFKTDDRGRKETIGEGAWSDVFLARPCPPKTNEQSLSQPPCGPEMTPPLTPVRTVDSAIDLTRLPITPPTYAVKVPAMTSAKKVLSAEARILSYLSSFPDAENHIVPFYGLDMRTGSLLLRAMDDTLEGWIQKMLNTLDEDSRARKLATVFPHIALTLLKSLQWMQEKFCTHADIKPSNILISSLSASISNPVYADFSSTILNHPDATIESCASPLGAGTWDYLDPSLLSSSSTTSPSATSDLWSLAITLLFLILGSSPYDVFKANKYQQREMIKSGCPLQCMRYDDQGIKNMNADFAAAQQRIAARRAQRALQQRNHHEPPPSTAQRALSRLPFPFSSLSTTGFSIWDAIKGRSGTRPEFRVGQVDAELLDEELLTLMKDQVGEGLKYFGSHVTDNYSAEILLALRAVLWKLSIWDQNASYGAHLQGLRYTDARSSAPNRPPPKPWQKVAYGAVTVGGRYAWTKWEEYLLSASEDYTRPESPRLKLLTRLSELAGNAHDVLGLASFLVFLVDGRYRTITDRLLRLRLTPTSHMTSREVSFEYLNRQLVWHAFTEFLLFLLPLVGISRWRRILSRTFKKLRTTVLSLLGRSKPNNDEGDEEAKAAGELAFLPERTCAICYRDQNPTTASEADILTSSAGGGGVVGSATTDITNPYEAIPCGCIYCFACIAQRIANEEGEGWTCLRCGETVKECRPWNGDIIEEQPRRVEHTEVHERPSTAKSVGFATSHNDEDNELDEKALLRQVDPMPEQEDVTDVTQEEQGIMGTTQTRGLDLGESLFTESSEWARASEDRSSDDEQSEEYDEDEEEEGEELGFYDQ